LAITEFLEVDLSPVLDESFARETSEIGVAIDVNGETQLTHAGRKHGASKANQRQHWTFEIGCIRHLFSAVIADRLAALNRINLDDFVARHVPALSDTPFGQSVQIRHLLSHSTGFIAPDAAGHPNVNDFTRDLRCARKMFPPGYYLLYTTRETLLLEEILSRASGQSIGALMNQFIFEVAQLRLRTVDAGTSWVASGFRAEDKDEEVSSRMCELCTFESYTLRISLTDLLQLCKGLLYHDPMATGSASLRDTLTSPVASLPNPISGTRITEVPTAFGLGCGTFSSGLFGLNGATQGFCSGFRVYPQCNVAFAVALSDCNHIRRNKIIEAIQRQLPLPIPNREASINILIDDVSVKSILGQYCEAFKQTPQRAHILQRSDAIVIVFKGEKMSSPDLTILRRNSDGIWQPARAAKQISLRFFQIQGSPAIGIMVGLTILWRCNEQ